MDAPPAFYSLPLSLFLFLSVCLSLRSPHLPSFLLPLSFCISPHHSSYLLGAEVLGCPLALWMINTPPPVHLRAGNPTCAHLHWLPWQRGPSVHQTGVWKNLFWGKSRRINTRTHWQPRSGPGSEVKEPCFLSRQTRAKHPSSLPLCLSASLSVWAWSLLDCTNVFFLFFFFLSECDWCRVCDGSLVSAALAHPRDY